MECAEPVGSVTMSPGAASATIRLSGVAHGVGGDHGPRYGARHNSLGGANARVAQRTHDNRVIRHEHGRANDGQLVAHGLHSIGAVQRNG